MLNEKTNSPPKRQHPVSSPPYSLWHLLFQSSHLGRHHQKYPCWQPLLYLLQISSSSCGLASLWPPPLSSSFSSWYCPHSPCQRSRHLLHHHHQLIEIVGPFYLLACSSLTGLRLGRVLLLSEALICDRLASGRNLLVSFEG